MYIKSIFSFTFFLTLIITAVGQNLQVSTIADLDASGGVTFGPDGHVYVSDFGPSLGAASVNTKVYKLEYGSWEISEFATGFSGASGARFDSQGNFYQSNPSGGRVSKVSLDGSVNLNWATGMSSPIGIVNDAEDNLYVCNCGANNVRKVLPNGSSTVFSSGTLFKCPNGITIDPAGNLYACNFNDGKIIKITPDGSPSLFATLPVLGGVGNGHITYANGFLFVATIGVGQIMKLTLDGESEVIAGIFQGFSNLDGPAMQSSFSKPNGIAASITGDTLWVNTSVPTWQTSNQALHPGKVRMITGVCSLSDVDCPLLSPVKEISGPSQNQHARLLAPTPNPITTTATFSFEIFSATHPVKLKVVDAQQRILRILEQGKKHPGIHNYNFATDTLSPGVYYLQLEVSQQVLTQKMVIL